MNCCYLTSSLVCLLTAEVTLWLTENKEVREGHATWSHESSKFLECRYFKTLFCQLLFLWGFLLLLFDIFFFCLFLFLSVCVCAFYGSFFYPTTHHRHSLSTVKLQQFQSCTDIHKYSCNLKTEVDFAKETTSLLSLM